MWYFSCEKWVHSQHPKYNVKLAVSKNGYEWKQTNHVCIQLKKNERAIARRYVIFEKHKFRMWYSFEKKIGNYKIGYAESKDGKNWKRMDNLFNFTSRKSFNDNQIHVAHNVKIGENCIIAGQVGFAGSSTLGNNVMIGGQAGISGHLKIGNNVQIGGGSGVIKNIPDNSKVMGYPAKDLKNFIRENK